VNEDERKPNEETDDTPSPEKDEDAAEQEAAAESQPGLAEQLGERYRKIAAWLTEEMDEIDQICRDRVSAAARDLDRKFPAEKRREVVHSVEEEFRQFGREIRGLLDKMQKNPRVAEAQEKTRDRLKSSLHQIRDWAGKAEERLEKKPAPEGESPPPPEAEDPAEAPGPEPPSPDEGEEESRG